MTKAYDRESFMARVTVRPDGCWEWTGHKHSLGYGKVGGKSKLAHRVAWEFFVGKPAVGDLHHLCHFRACVNPAHLQELDRVDHAKLHNSDGDRCRKGHLWADGNSYQPPAARARQCKACMNASAREYYRSRKFGDGVQTIPCPTCGIGFVGLNGLRVHQGKTKCGAKVSA